MNIQLSDNLTSWILISIVFLLFFISALLRIKDSRQRLKQGKGSKLLDRLNIIFSAPILFAVIVILLLLGVTQLIGSMLD